MYGSILKEIGFSLTHFSEVCYNSSSQEQILSSSTGAKLNYSLLSQRTGRTNAQKEAGILSCFTAAWQVVEE